jgi:hypothetical protein
MTSKSKVISINGQVAAEPRGRTFNVENLDESDFKCLEGAWTAIQTMHGCTTPAEQFICDLLSDYADGHLTPQIAKQGLQEFRENFAMMTKRTAEFAARHPKLFAKAAEAKVQA